MTTPGPIPPAFVTAPVNSDRTIVVEHARYLGGFFPEPEPQESSFLRCTEAGVQFRTRRGVAWVPWNDVSGMEVEGIEQVSRRIVTNPQLDAAHFGFTRRQEDAAFVVVKSGASEIIFGVSGTTPDALRQAIEPVLGRFRSGTGEHAAGAVAAIAGAGESAPSPVEAPAFDPASFAPTPSTTPSDRTVGEHAVPATAVEPTSASADTGRPAGDPDSLAGSEPTAPETSSGPPTNGSFPIEHVLDLSVVPADRAADLARRDQGSEQPSTAPRDAVQHFLEKATDQGLLDPLHDPADDEALRAASETLESARSAAAAALSAAGAAERAAETLHHFTVVRTTEAEIGDLLIRCQRFIENAIGDAERQAHQIVAAARSQADGIITEATRRAGELEAAPSRELPAAAPLPAPPMAPTIGPPPVLTAETAQELNSTIDGYIRVNAELMHELRLLSGSLGMTQPAQAEGGSPAQ